MRDVASPGVVVASKGPDMRSSPAGSSDVVAALSAWTTTQTSEPVRIETHEDEIIWLHVVAPDGLMPAPWVASDADIVIGRTPSQGATFIVPHGTVSRRHTLLRWDSDLNCHVASDLGSHNGTRVNGDVLGILVAEHVMCSGDVLRIGDVVLVYERGPRVVGAGRDALQALPGASMAMTELRAAVCKVATDPSPVLLHGETGSGKEHVARELHRLSGRTGPFVPVNCAALSPALIESLLFGHETGAFTGAARRNSGLFRAAHGGTLLLDEIGELPLDVQPKLLRVLQDRQVRAVGASTEVAVDVRVLAATHRDLETMVEAGTFRRDLHARLALLELRVPPLRQRRPDVLMWWRRLEAQWADERGEPCKRAEFPPESVEALLRSEWPSNLRGVDTRLRRFAVRSGGARPVLPDDVRDLASEAVGAPGEDQLDAPAVSAPRRRQSSASSVTVSGATQAPQPPRQPTPTRSELLAVLRETGSIRATAKALRRDRRQIYRWVQAYAVVEAEWQSEDAEPEGPDDEDDEDGDDGGFAR